MSEPIDLDFLEQKKYEAIRLEEHLDCTDHWSKPYYSNVYKFKPGVRRVLIGVNPGGNCQSKKYYEKYGYEEKIWSENRKSFNSYLDERWGDRPSGAQRKGEDSLQIAVQRVFRTMYEPKKWKNRLRNTPCFNLVPVSSKGTRDPELDEIWDNGVDWSIELLEYLKPKFIILYGNGKTGKSVWAVLKSKFGLEDCEKTPLPFGNHSIKEGVFAERPLKGVAVLALPHLSHVKGKNLDTLCRKLQELRPFPRTRFRS